MKKMELLKKEANKEKGKTPDSLSQKQSTFFDDKPEYWKDLMLVWNAEHTNIKSIPSNITNHEIMIAEDEALKGKIKLNELDKLIHFPDKFVLTNNKNNYVFEGTITDDNITAITGYLERKYSDYNFKPKKEIVSDVLINIARNNKYNPIKDYIKYCHQQWLAQGNPEMITKLFPKYLGTEKNKTNDLISKIWLTELVTRPFDIDKVADYVLNLVGPQGCGKTLIFELLSRIPNQLNNVSLKDSKPCKTTWKYSSFENKDQDLQMIKSWIVVDEEMNVRKKMTDSEYKDKVSSMTGQKEIRAAYRRNSEFYDVFCTLGATSNVIEFLNDPTGNRRELPLLCEPNKAEKSLSFYTDELAEECWHDCQLAIGQAYQLYLDNYRYYQRTAEEKDMLESATEQFKTQDSAQSELDLYLENKDIVLVEELVRRINNFSALPNNKKVTANKVNKIMLQYSNQWVKKRGKLNTKIKDYYQNPENLESQELSAMVGETLAHKIKTTGPTSLVAYYVRKGGKFD